MGLATARATRLAAIEKISRILIVIYPASSVDDTRWRLMMAINRTLHFQWHGVIALDKTQDYKNKTIILIIIDSCNFWPSFSTFLAKAASG